MTTTVSTITLPGIGPVPALPDELHQVADAASHLPAGTYGVVVASTPRPVLLTSPTGLTTIGVQRLADTYLRLGGPAFCVWIVRRTTVRHVTVHRPDLTHPGHLLGTAQVEHTVSADTRNPQDRYWDDLVARVAHDSAAQRDHDANIVAAIRRAHRLSADTSTARVYATALREPLPAHRYIRAFMRLLCTKKARRQHLYATHRTTP